jgi:diaminopropionate ammonia-lyase
MASTLHSQQTADQIAQELLRLSPRYAPTPLLDLPTLAARLGVAKVLVKDEGRRTLGSFKSLGGTYAGLRALARVARTDVAGLLEGKRPGTLPALLCASDGNHGLAVAAAAKFAGAPARIYLHSGVGTARAHRIEAQGAEIVWVDGTYDDAVDAALAAAKGDEGILVADTTHDPSDPVSADVLAGYGVMAFEIRRQAEAAGHDRPTHLFAQAGCGGLAAAMTLGLKDWLAAPGAVIVVEPEKAACVAAALNQGRVVRVPGDLVTSAEMLSCGEASAPALDVLRQAGAKAIRVSDAALAEATALLSECCGPGTTPSGAAGVAGAMTVAASPDVSRDIALDAGSRVLLVVTETELDKDEP